MDDAFGVDIAHAQTELAEDLPGLMFRQAALLDEIVEKLATGAELGDQPDGLLGRDDLVHLYDAGVVEAAVVMDLSGEERGRAGLWDVLDGDPRPGQSMYA